MDPLVFSIMTSESESASGSAMKVHPGDCAAPLDILEWLDKFDEKIESTSYGQVRRGQIPAALLRSTEPKDLSAMPPLTVGTGITQADVEKRATYIALTTAENARMTAERESTMRDYKNRLAALVVSAMRETALNTLTELKAKFEDSTVSGMYDGPAMLDEMRTKAKAELAAGDDETEKRAVAELDAWKARVPPGGCASKDMVKHWTHWQLYINPYVAVPLVINTKPYNDFLVDTMSHMGVKDRVWSVKERLKAAGTYNTTAEVIKAYAAMHARSPAPTAPRTSTRLPTAPSPPCSLTARATTGTTSRRSRTTRFPRARTTSGRRLSTTTSRSTSRRRTAPPSTASFPCICFDRCLSRGGVETPMPPQT